MSFDTEKFMKKVEYYHNVINHAFVNNIKKLKDFGIEFSWL